MEFDRAFLSTKFKASGPTKFNDNELRGTEFGMQGSAAERKILTAHGILKFKDASAR